MDNKKYEALLLVAEYGSITSAADAMGYTQSGITQMINSLEKELGLKLLTRTNKGAALTSAGKELLPLMREEQRYENHIKQECARMKGLETGTVTVGCLSSISCAWLPDILQNFAAEHPHIKVNLIEAEAHNLEDMLQTGRIDLAVTELRDKSSFNNHLLLSDEILAVIPEGHELASRTNISLDKLTRYPFIVWSTGDNGADDISFPVAITGGKYKIDASYDCRNDFTALQMVSRGLGVSVAGKLLLDVYDVGTVNIPLDPPLFRRLGIAIRLGEKPLRAAQSFIDCVKETVLPEA